MYNENIEKIPLILKDLKDGFISGFKPDQGFGKAYNALLFCILQFFISFLIACIQKHANLKTLILKAKE